MRIATEADQSVIEGIVNAVWDKVADDGAKPFDATPHITFPNRALIVKGGCFLLTWHGSGRVEAHTNFMPTMRGKRALIETRKAMAHVFLETNVHFIVTRVPQCNPQADWFARANGFRLRFERKNAWRKNGADHSVKYYELDIDDWIMRGHCVKAGQTFHDLLHDRLPGHQAHDDDYAHDCYVGAAACMLRAGNVEKAVFIYNRWALFAGYQPITVVSQDPLRLDIRDCILTIKDGEFAVEG